MGRLNLTCALIALISAAMHVSGQTFAVTFSDSLATKQTLNVATCEELAKNAGRPLDGWQVITTDDGEQQCQRITVDLLCAGEQLYHPTTRKASCCNPPSTVTWTDQPKKLGYCCAQGHQWVGDAASGAGGCCPTGYTWDNGKCKSPTPVPPPVPPPVPVRDCVTQCPTVNSAACGGDPVCANAKDLGIEYGKCYILSFDDGAQLGVQRDNTYARGGFFQDIPFKVCKAATDCSAAGPVPHDGAFYLADQAGRYTDATAKPGWVGTASNGVHMAWTDQPASAAMFKGSAACAGGKCAVKLTGGSRGLGAACPADKHGITFWNNPNMGMNLRFTEVRCDGKSKLAPA